MKTSDSQYQLLLHQATTLYNVEKELSAIFDALKENTKDSNLMQGIALEAEENKRHCTRLEGLLEVLNRTPYHNDHRHEPEKENFIRQFSLMLKRISFKHAHYGYKTAMFVASALGRDEIANFLRCSMSQGEFGVGKASSFEVN